MQRTESRRPTSRDATDSWATSRIRSATNPPARSGDRREATSLTHSPRSSRGRARGLTPPWLGANRICRLASMRASDRPQTGKRKGKTAIESEIWNKSTPDDTVGAAAFEAKTLIFSDVAPALIEICASSYRSSRMPGGASFPRIRRTKDNFKTRTRSDAYRPQLWASQMFLGKSGHQPRECVMFIHIMRRHRQSYSSGLVSREGHFSLSSGILSVRYMLSRDKA